MSELRKTGLAVLWFVAAISCTREILPSPDCGNTEETCGEYCIDVQISDEAAARIDGGITSAADIITLDGVVSAGRIFPDAGKWEERHRQAGLHKWYRVKMVSVAGTKAKAELEELEDIVYACPNPGVRTCSDRIPFNDRYASYQWGLYNDGNMPSHRNVFKKGADINVVPVWQEFTAGTPDVTVAVVDGGIYNHPDLEGVIVPAGEFGSRNFVEKYADNPYEIKPELHATCVASIIGAINDNRIWFCGVAGGRDGKGGARILNCQIIATDEQDEKKTDAALNTEDAIVWAADHGAVICNNSWGFDYDDGKVPSETPRQVAAAIDYFTEYAGVDLNGRQTGKMRGGLVIFAAGNERAGMAQPAAYENVLAVGAFGPDGKRAEYSNYGAWVDICAPGGNADAYKVYGDDSKYSMIAGLPADGSDYFYFMEGTSMACPFVTGTAALLVSYFGGEGFTPDMLREMLLSGADYSYVNPFDRYQIGPRLDAYGAFTAQHSDPLPPDALSVEAVGNKALFEWNVTGTDGRACFGYRAFVSKYPDMRDALTMDFITMGMRVGEKASFLFRNLDFETDYYCTLCGISSDRVSQSTMSEVHSIRSGRNHAPIKTGDIPDCVMEKGDALRISLSEHFSDEDDEILDVRAEMDNLKSVEFNEDGEHLVFTALEPGMTDITLKVSDRTGSEAQTSFRILVRDSENQPYDLYPVPVNDILSIRPGSREETTFNVLIFNSYGKVIMNDNLKGSLYGPAQVDMSRCAPGVYEVKLRTKETEYSKSIVKK